MTTGAEMTPGEPAEPVIKRRAKMKTFQEAQDAIQHSIDFDTIAACVDTPENRDYLQSECDGSVENHNDNYAGQHVIDYWSDDDEDTSGMGWRVFLIVEETAEEND